MAQPRLNYTMAMDGVLPAVFAEVDEEGNLKAGTKIAGAIMISIATIVPFAYLDDLISSGILIAFTITDTSVILVRQASPDNNPFLLERMLIAFHTLSILSGFLLRNCLSLGVTGAVVRFMTLLSCLGTLFIGNRIRTHCPFNDEPSTGLFLTPFVPALPLCGCFVSIACIYTLFTYPSLTMTFLPISGESIPHIAAGDLWISCDLWLCWFGSSFQHFA